MRVFRDHPGVVTAWSLDFRSEAAMQTIYMPILFDAASVAPVVRRYGSRHELEESSGYETKGVGMTNSERCITFHEDHSHCGICSDW